jgi:acyl-CoA thioester hydrolase
MRLELSDFNFLDKYQVHWIDMDVANHVNNLVYLKWTETLRMKFFEEIKMDTSFSKGSIGPILGAQTCKYIFPMRYPDTAIVGLKIQSISIDRFVILSAVFSEKHDRIATYSTHEAIPYDYGKLTKVDMPNSWNESLKLYQ